EGEVETALVEKLVRQESFERGISRDEDLVQRGASLAVRPDPHEEEPRDEKKHRVRTMERERQGKLSGTGSSVHDSGIEEEGRRRRTTAGTRMRRIQGRNADPLTRRRRSNSITAPPLGEHPIASTRTRPEEFRRRGKVEAASEKRVAFDRERSAASRRGPRRGSEPPAGDDARPRARP